MTLAPKAMADRPHVVYYAFDARDWCLYIGVTSNLTQRLKAHGENAPWRHDMAYLATSGWLDAESAYELESREISQLGPVWNKIRNTAKMISGQDAWRARWLTEYAPRMDHWRVLDHLENWLYFDHVGGHSLLSFPTDVLKDAYEALDRRCREELGQSRNKILSQFKSSAAALREPAA